MNKLCIIFLIFSLTINMVNAEEGDEHASHDHKETKHSKDDGHEHNKKQKHDEHKHSEGHDNIESSSSPVHVEHTDHDDHKEEKGHADHGEHGEHGGGKAVGKGKAIEEVDENKGFKLSKEAIKTLKLKLQTVDGDEFSIDKTTLVSSKSTKGLYRFRGGFFKFMPVELLKESKGKYLVKVKGVDFGDQIVIDGVGLLRVTDVYSTDTSEYGHSH
ncbi:MAG: hypothetical protein CME66_11870 [Halobacteriovoraceae bacterium]|nr:hypothetical protein [Halobacteriovoraceae bacterium]